MSTTINNLLLTAVNDERSEVLSYLLNKGANPNFNNAEALYLAIFSGQDNMIEALANSEMSDDNIVQAFRICIELALYDSAIILLKSAAAQKRTVAVEEIMTNLETRLLEKLFTAATNSKQFEIALGLAIFEGVDINYGNEMLVKAIVAAGDIKKLKIVENKGANIEKCFDELKELAPTTEIKIFLEEYWNLYM